MPVVKKNLMSVYKVCRDNNMSFGIDKYAVSIKEHETEEEVATDEVKDGLYEIDLTNKTIPEINSVEKASSAWSRERKKNSRNYKSISITCFKLQNE